MVGGLTPPAEARVPAAAALVAVAQEAWGALLTPPAEALVPAAQAAWAALRGRRVEAPPELALREVHPRQRVRRQQLQSRNQKNGRSRIQDLQAQVAAELQHAVPVETLAHLGEWEHEKAADLPAESPGQRKLQPAECFEAGWAS